MNIVSMMGRGCPGGSVVMVVREKDSVCVVINEVEAKGSSQSHH